MSKKDPLWIIFFVILVMMFIAVEPFLPGKKTNHLFWNTIGIVIIVFGIITMFVIR